MNFTDNYLDQCKTEPTFWKVIGSYMSTATKKEINIYQDESLLCAIHDHYAVIEFTPDGHIIDANDNFFSAMGFSKEEVIGKHHQIFCDPEYAGSLEYKQFWKDLSEGKAKIGEFKRFTKGKELVWLSASYTPIYNEAKEVVKVVKFAQNKTEQILKSFDERGKVNAIGRAQAVIEFELDGTILDANENFCQTLG